MGIRFTSFEAYKSILADNETGVPSSRATFLGKLIALRALESSPWSSALIAVR